MPRGKSAISARKPQDSVPGTPTRTPRPAKGSKMAAQHEDIEQAPLEREQEQSNFEALMQAITNCQSTLTGKIEQMQLDISLIRRDMDTFRNRLSEAERRVGDAEDVLQDHTVSLRTLQTKIKALETRAEDAENRNRRNNLRIVGLPEGTEGAEPTSFTEKLLRELLPQAVFSDVFVVERAHRMPATRGPPGAPPRTFILKLLNFRDRDLVLRESRKIEQLRYEGAKLMIFPDFSIDTQKQRRSFDQVKMNLRNKKIKYSMLFPARLRVQDGERVRFFTSPEEASQWLETIQRH